MKAERKFALALKEMMEQMPLENVSVSALCQKTHMARASFYYYFHDIYDLLTVVFLEEKIKDIETINSSKDLIALIYNYYDQNKLFIDATLSSACKDLVTEFIYNACYQGVMTILNRLNKEYEPYLDQKKIVARFFANGFSNSIVYYLVSYNNKTLRGLNNQFAFVSEEEIIKSLQRLIKKTEILNIQTRGGM